MLHPLMLYTFFASYPQFLWITIFSPSSPPQKRPHSTYPYVSLILRSYPHFFANTTIERGRISGKIFLWITFSHGGELSTKSVDKFSTSSTFRIAGYIARYICLIEYRVIHKKCGQVFHIIHIPYSWLYSPLYLSDRIPSYPQKLWISFPHYPHSV